MLKIPLVLLYATSLGVALAILAPTHPALAAPPADDTVEEERVRVYDIYPPRSSIEYPNDLIPIFLRKFKLSITNEAVEPPGRPLSNVRPFVRRTSAGPISASIPQGWASITIVYSLDDGMSYIPYCLERFDYPVPLASNAFERNVAERAFELKSGLRPCGNPVVPMLEMLSLESESAVREAGRLSDASSEIDRLRVLGYIARMLDGLSIELRHASEEVTRLKNEVQGHETRLATLISEGKTDEAQREQGSIDAKQFLLNRLRDAIASANAAEQRLLRRKRIILGEVVEDNADLVPG